MRETWLVLAAIDNTCGQKTHVREPKALTGGDLGEFGTVFHFLYPFFTAQGCVESCSHDDEEGR